MAKKSKQPTEPEEKKEVCPKCGSPLGEVTTTPSGKRLQRCSTGSWNPQTKKVEGCDYVKWLDAIPQELDETCPKCGNKLVMMTTRSGRRLKKCSTAGWDREARQATGCDYVQWINTTTKEPLNEDCPLCGNKLVMVTTSQGKKMKKCSTAGWDPKKREATGCTFIEWQNANSPARSNGDENFPSEEL